MPIPTEVELLAAACHFGHPKEKWNPKMAPYLWGSRKGIHIFDLTQTRTQVERACRELQALSRAGKTILFVSTKQQSIPLVEEIGHTLKQPIVTKRWIPGLLTNWGTVKRRIQYYLDLQRSFQTGDVEKYTKKEQLMLRRKLAKLDTALSGVASLANLPDAMFVVDAVRDRVAVLEARNVGIPVYGICDSNADPDVFAVAIPCNDDAVKAIALILQTVKDALLQARDEKEEKEQSNTHQTVLVQ